MMLDLVNELRLHAEDIHCVAPTSDVVAVMSLAADEIETLRNKLAKAEQQIAHLQQELRDSLEAMGVKRLYWDGTKYVEAQ